MSTDGNSLPVVESTPAVNATEATPQAAPATAVPNADQSLPQYVTKDALLEVLGGFEQRITQVTKDTVKSAVNKAQGVPRGTTQTPPPPAVQEVETPPATEPPVQETQVPATSTEPLPLELQYLQQDGVDISQPIDQFVLEAYRIQAQAGISLAGQPEMDMIDSTDPVSYLVTIKEAVLAAKERMESEGTYQDPADIVDSLALSAGLGAGTQVRTPKHAKLSGNATLDMAFGVK